MFLENTKETEKTHDKTLKLQDKNKLSVFSLSEKVEHKCLYPKQLLQIIPKKTQISLTSAKKKFYRVCPHGCFEKSLEILKTNKFVSSDKTQLVRCTLEEHPKALIAVDDLCEDLIDQHNAGIKDCYCLHCGASFWLLEKNANSSIQKPKLSICCNNAEIKIHNLVHLSSNFNH